MVQMGAILWSRPMVCTRFFRHMGAHNFRLAGQWLYYGFYWMLVLSLGGLLQMVNTPGHMFGVFRIVSQMMDLINAKFACAWDLGHLDARFCPYHYNLRKYEGLAVRVMRMY